MTDPRRPPSDVDRLRDALTARVESERGRAGLLDGVRARRRRRRQARAGLGAILAVLVAAGAGGAVAVSRGQDGAPPSASSSPSVTANVDPECPDTTTPLPSPGELGSLHVGHVRICIGFPEPRRGTGERAVTIDLDDADTARVVAAVAALRPAATDSCTAALAPAVDSSYRVDVVTADGTVTAGRSDARCRNLFDVGDEAYGGAALRPLLDELTAGERCSGARVASVDQSGRRTELSSAPTLDAGPAVLDLVAGCGVSVSTEDRSVVGQDHLGDHLVAGDLRLRPGRTTLVVQGPDTCFGYVPDSPGQVCVGGPGPTVRVPVRVVSDDRPCAGTEVVLVSGPTRHVVFSLYGRAERSVRLSATVPARLERVGSCGQDVDVFSDDGAVLGAALQSGGGLLGGRQALADGPVELTPGRTTLTTGSVCLGNPHPRQCLAPEVLISVTIVVDP